MRLKIELVPSTSWGDNLRSELSKTEWTKISRATSDKADGKCEVCGQKPRTRRPDCHEIWEYDDENKVQKLIGLVALCSTCHKAKHLGRTLSVEPIEVQERVLKKIMAMNDFDQKDLEAYVAEVFYEHHLRSQHTWSVDTSWLKGSQK